MCTVPVQVAVHGRHGHGLEVGQPPCGPPPRTVPCLLPCPTPTPCSPLSSPSTTPSCDGSEAGADGPARGILNLQTAQEVALGRVITHFLASGHLMVCTLTVLVRQGLPALTLSPWLTEEPFFPIKGTVLLQVHHCKAKFDCVLVCELETICHCVLCVSG